MVMVLSDLANFGGGDRERRGMGGWARNCVFKGRYQNRSVNYYLILIITYKVENVRKKVPIKKIYHLVNLRAKLRATESEGQMNDPPIFRPWSSENERKAWKCKYVWWRVLAGPSTVAPRPAYYLCQVKSHQLLKYLTMVERKWEKGVEV
jgi:hypothetical protein